MRRFIIRRFVFSIVSIVVATMAVFLLSRAAGDPLLLYATSGYGLTAESEAALRKRLALDRPVPVQYALWLGRTLKGDMGETIRDRKPVARVVTQLYQPLFTSALPHSYCRLWWEFLWGFCRLSSEVRYGTTSVDSLLCSDKRFRNSG